MLKSLNLSTYKFDKKTFTSIMLEKFNIVKLNLKITCDSVRFSKCKMCVHNDFEAKFYQQYVMKYSAGSMSLKSLKCLDQSQLNCMSANKTDNNCFISNYCEDKAVLYYCSGLDHYCGSIQLYKITADKITISGPNSKHIRHLCSYNPKQNEEFVTLFCFKQIKLINYSVMEEVNLEENSNLYQYVKRYICKKKSFFKHKAAKCILSKYFCIVPVRNLDYFKMKFSPELRYIDLSAKVLIVVVQNYKQSYLKKAIEYFQRIPDEQDISVMFKDSCIHKDIKLVKKLIQTIFSKRIIKVKWNLNCDITELYSTIIKGFRQCSKLNHFEGFVHGSYFTITDIISKSRKEVLCQLFNKVIDANDFLEYMISSYRIFG